jgi:hypothetical protein
MAETQTKTWQEIDGFPEDDGKVAMIHGLPRLDGVYNSLQRLVGNVEMGEPLYRVVHHDSKPVKGEDLISVAYVGENDNMHDVLQHPFGYGAKRLVEASVELIPQEVLFSD